MIITSENSGGINFRKDFKCITSKYLRGINIVIQAFRMVYAPPCACVSMGLSVLLAFYPLVDVSDIFYFSLLGEGEGGVRGARRKGGSIFY